MAVGKKGDLLHLAAEAETMVGSWAVRSHQVSLRSPLKLAVSGGVALVGEVPGLLLGQAAPRLQDDHETRVVEPLGCLHAEEQLLQKRVPEQLCVKFLSRTWKTLLGP